jgi:hypothetical protein
MGGGSYKTSISVHRAISKSVQHGQNAAHGHMESRQHNTMGRGTNTCMAHTTQHDLESPFCASQAQHHTHGGSIVASGLRMRVHTHGHARELRTDIVVVLWHTNTTQPMGRTNTTGLHHVNTNCCTRQPGVCTYPDGGLHKRAAPLSRQCHSLLVSHLPAGSS